MPTTSPHPRARALRLFKLRLFDDHCHVVASHDDRGVPVDLPGVDLRGADAAAAFHAAAPLLDAVRARGDGREVRAVSVHLERRRILATFAPRAGERTPPVARIDGEAFDDVLPRAAEVIALLADAAASRLAVRRLPTLAELTAAERARASAETLRHYEREAEAFWQGTRDHDVSQNIAALLRHLPDDGCHTILDLGCGPGRDLATFRDLGHEAVGLDGARAFVEMARAHTGCEVLLQDFLDMHLPQARFDGVFANASLFHVPSQELPRVLGQLHDALVGGGVLFCSNPHGPNTEGWSGGRYGTFLDLDTFRRFMTHAGFEELEHYYRPTGQPRHRQPWLATVWRR
jgi:SAM-dependent methyltransferase